MTPALDHESTRAPADPAAVAQEIVGALTPLLNSVQVVRLVAGPTPGLETALAIITRQADRLCRLADELRDPDANGD